MKNNDFHLGMIIKRALSHKQSDAGRQWSAAGYNINLRSVKCGGGGASLLDYSKSDWLLFYVASWQYRDSKEAGSHDYALLLSNDFKGSL